MMRRPLALAVAVLAMVAAHVDAAAGAPGARDPNSPSWAHASDGRVPSWARETGGAPSAPSSGSWLDGVDVSHWQGTIDWSKVAGSGKSFAIMKATDGTTYVDPTYSTNRSGALAAGLVVTAYHFARPASTAGDAAAEADHFVDTAGIGTGDIVPVLDLERDGGLSTSALIAWTQAWVDEVKHRTGVTPMIYTGPYRWSTKMGDTQTFADEGVRLWLAHWTTGTPTVPGNDWGGNGWTFWQYTDCGTVPGIAGCVDLDHFNGTSLTPVRIPRLTVTVTAGGGVTSSPVGIDCGSTCQSVFDPGSTVALQASPDPGAVLVGWGRACAGSGDCSVRMIGNRQVDAVFGYTLTASVSSPGGGSVTSSPPGITCGSAGTSCSGSYASGTSVTLTATADAGSQFSGWSGDCSGWNFTCTVGMDAAHTVAASFADDTPPTVSLRVPATLRGPAAAAFDEPVHDVSVSDVVLRVEGTGGALPSALACVDRSGSSVSCATGEVARAVLRPSSSLLPGQNYVLIVNPNGVTPQVADRGGNPAPETSRSFRAATAFEESNLVFGHGWRVVRDHRASGGRYAVAHDRGASLRFAFRGTAIRWITVKGPDQGHAAAYVDGRRVGIFDGYASHRSYGVSRVIAGLDDRVHTVRIVVLGTARSTATGTAVSVDAFRVT